MKRIVLICLLFCGAASVWGNDTADAASLPGTVTQKEYRVYHGTIGGQATVFFLTFDEISSRAGMVVPDWRGDIAYEVEQLSFSFSRAQTVVNGTFVENGETVLFNGTADAALPYFLVGIYHFETEEGDRRFIWHREIPFFPTLGFDAAKQMTAVSAGDLQFPVSKSYGNESELRVYFAEKMSDELRRWKEAAASPGAYHFEQSSYIRFLYADADLISLKVLTYEYRGGAHGLTAVSGLVFDRQSGTRISGLNWLNMSDAQFVSAVREKLITPPSTLTEESFNDYERLGFDPECEWMLTYGGVLFIWSQYQLGPYASGMPAVLFSVKEIAPYVKKKSFPGRLFD